MAHIQAKAKVGRAKALKKLMMESWIALPDVFKQQGAFQQLGPLHKGLPQGHAPLQPCLAMTVVMTGIIAGMAHHLERVENGREIEKPSQTTVRHVPDERIDTAGAKIPEWSMQGDSAPGVLQLLRGTAQIQRRYQVELFRFKANFHIQAPVQNRFQVHRQVFPWHVHMYLPQKIPHVFVQRQRDISFGVLQVLPLYTHHRPYPCQYGMPYFEKFRPVRPAASYEQPSPFLIV